VLIQRFNTGYLYRMVYEEFKRQLGNAGISGREFSRLVKLNPNSLTNYAKTGKIPAHWAIIAALMGEMAEQGIDYRSVIEKIEFEPNKVRGAAKKGIFGGDSKEQLPLKVYVNDAG
jgi:hypothetical protein